MMILYDILQKKNQQDLYENKGDNYNCQAGLPSQPDALQILPC